MLVLERTEGQVIEIEGGIEIHLVRVRPNPRGGPRKVKLGIVAPKGLKVLRRELVERGSLGKAKVNELPSEQGARTRRRRWPSR